MAYNHYFNALTNTSGDSLIGYFARVVDTSTGSVVPIYSDNSGTPVSVVSGVTNMAKTDEYGNISLYVDPGTYNLDIYAPDAVTFRFRVPNVAMNSTKGDKGDPGDTGAPGPADNTYSTLTTFKASDINRKAARLVGASGITDGSFNWTLGNFTGQTDDINIIKADSTGLSVGAWVRQGADSVRFQQFGTGSVTRTSQAKLRERISVFDFGAVGDGTTNDTAAIKAAIAALPSGGTLYLGSGNTFLINQSLIFTKPIRIVGGDMEKNKLLFSSSGTYQNIGDGTRAAIIVMHSQTVISGYSGDARRSSFEGFAVEAQAGIGANTRGIVICAPMYLYEMRVAGFSSDGFAVMAGNNSPIDGIANGTVFTNCAAQANGGSGFYFSGDDANACLINRCFGADNGSWAFFDDSLLGNTYISCEADNNGDGGYFATPLKPCACSYLGCYSETPTHFSVGPLCQMWGSQGLYKPTRASGGVIFRGLPAGAAYCSQPIRVAATDDIANSGGESPNAGPFIGVGDDGIDYRATATSRHLRINGLLSANYTDILSGADPVFRMPNSAVTGNLAPGRAWAPTGISIGSSGDSAIVGAGTAAPTTGTYAAGAIFLNQAPAAGGKIGWVCVTGGSPGTWKPWGAIDA